MVKLRFIAENDPGSWLIRYWTFYDYSHVEFVLPEGYLGARVNGGVQIRPFDYVKPAKEVFAQVDLPAAKEWAVLSYAKAQVGKPYDLGAIIGLVLKQDWENKNAWFCSELVATAFDIAGCPIINSAQVDRITPRDIAISPLVQF